jgi:hypothetical protein
MIFASVDTKIARKRPEPHASDRDTNTRQISLAAISPTSVSETHFNDRNCILTNPETQKEIPSCLI